MEIRDDTPIDGGATAAGRPFFAMELVQGEPITQFCGRARLPIRDRIIPRAGWRQSRRQWRIRHTRFHHEEHGVIATDNTGRPTGRHTDPFPCCPCCPWPVSHKTAPRYLRPRRRLALVTDVCRAVQHAHQKGIIHRDLKSSNVLVTTQDGRPAAKVIDFGIAKAIEKSPTDRTFATQAGPFVGTPADMIPEQLGLTNQDIGASPEVAPEARSAGPGQPLAQIYRLSL